MTTNTKTTRVMTVDDDEGTRLFVSKVLTNAGYSIIEAADGSEVDAKLAHIKDVKLILLDINMQNRNGIETLRKLKSDEKTKSIPVVMLTEIGKRELVNVCGQLGASGYIVKPASKEVLLERVAQHIPLSLTFDDIREIISRTHFEDQSIRTAPGLEEFRSPRFKCFPAPHKGHRVCVIVTGEAYPKTLVTRSESELSANLMVFARNVHRWYKVWPEGGIRELIALAMEETAAVEAAQVAKLQEINDSKIRIPNSMSELMTMTPEGLKEINFGASPATDMLFLKQVQRNCPGKDAAKQEMNDMIVSLWSRT